MSEFTPDSVPGGVGRRTFLSLTGVSATAFLLGLGAAPTPVHAAEALPADPFTLGVASGDPLPDGVVLWTRLAMRPLAADGRGGMPNRDIRVRYEIAEDERFARVVRRGTAVATPELGHSVHPEVGGLKPGRDYYYRFRVGGFTSPAGRTRTAPARGAAVERLRFATASCQAWYHGYYTAYRHMAADNLDVIFFLGDYIYEYGIVAGDNLERQADLGPEHGVKVTTLEQFRLRYSLTKTDPDLQAAHASAPWVVTWDDHEVENNYAAAVSQYGVPEREFLARRAAAYQVFYENLPLRSVQTPDGPSVRMYRTLPYGSLADVHVLDTRQYRDTYPAGRVVDNSPERLDPARTILGRKQERWLTGAFRDSTARWNLLANQVVMAQIDRDLGSGRLYSNDQWDGFPACRERVLTALRRARIRNFVVLTGDIHRNVAAEIKADFDDPDSRTLGVELVCSSISSDRDGARSDSLAQIWLQNPHVRLYNAQRGYLRCEATRESLTADFRIVPYVTRPGAGVETLARYTIPAGEMGLPGTAPQQRP
ncbi:alkaline phosphatase D family protein [Marinitenerispora sediminis]|uniref:Alkaline phosphatase n=1 Tax=Marinitenerispora sediminis TaxID=1931232 RepID=A0A368TE16_9ACTN|nr:alkaline phosphatase D family protein [Marinitenerispora sediminis]RCV57111.1 alkaline phosphatase [Marinitenerispora sediminis]RCV58896.1 alkaline phosphatase [Marinitenerispora sediminis]RCV62160.1 alkaline phosphatase [Marinitenerispora sediminis]